MRREREGVRAEIGELPALDGLRGIAVLWVILFHVHVLHAPNDPWMALVDLSRFTEPVLGAGYLGVDLFFLLSGFLLALPWFEHAARGAAPPATRAFYARRARRIVPAYYVQLALLFAVVLPILRGIDYWRSDLYVYLYNGLAHALFLHNTTPLSSGSMQVNGALWTLAVEAQFYLLLPLFAPLVARWPWRAVAAALAVSVAWRLGASDGLTPLVDLEMSLGRHWGWSEASVRSMLLHQLPAYSAHFVLGMALGGGWLARRAAAPRATPAGALLAVSLTVLYMAIAINGDFAGRASWMIPLACLAGVLWWAATSDRARAWLGTGPLAFMGRVSYSAYLVHLPMLLVWNRTMTGLPAWLSLPLYLAAVIALSWLSSRFVERPFMARRGGRRDAASPALNDEVIVTPR